MGIKIKIEYILKHNSFVYWIYHFVGSLFFRFIGLFIPIKTNRILFTGHGRRFNDSPRAIYEYIISHPEFDKYELIWALDDPSSTVLSGRGRVIKSDTLRYFITALSSKYWVTCVNIERGLNFKKKSIIYLNTWHGFPTKGISNNDTRKNEDLSYINYFCSAGSYDKEFYHNFFNIPYDRILLCGYPRMDSLYNSNLLSNDLLNEFKVSCGIPLDKKIILYAPTWRENDNSNSSSFRAPINIDKWNKNLGKNYVLLMRLHPYTQKAMNIAFDSFVINVSNIPDANMLLIISDILISDYSGIFFEYAVLEKPIICFGYDIEQYKTDRGLALDLETELPNGVIKTEDEVINHILNLDYNYECQKTRDLKNKYLQYGGNASQLCLKSLLS